jgi:biopolymer transport protein ExbD
VDKMLASWRKPTSCIRNSSLNTFVPAMAVFAAVTVMLEMTIPRPFHGDMTPYLPKIAWPIYLPQAMREDAILVTISRDGSIFVRKDRVSPDQIASAIRQSMTGGSERKVYIQADARTLYRNVKQVLDAAHEAGLINVSFLAEQKRR